MTAVARKPLYEDPIHGAHVMEIPDETGDTKIMWSKDNAEEVEVARKTFDDMKKKKFKAFHVKGKNGEPAEEMHNFDPDAERIIFIKQQAGG